MDKVVLEIQAQKEPKGEWFGTDCSRRLRSLRTLRGIGPKTLGGKINFPRSDRMPAWEGVI